MIACISGPLLFQLSNAFGHRDICLLIQLSTGRLHLLPTFLDIMNNAVMSIWLQILCVKMFQYFGFVLVIFHDWGIIPGKTK